MQSRTEVFNRVPDMVRFLAELPEYGVELYTHKKMKTDSVVALRALELIGKHLGMYQDKLKLDAKLDTGQLGKVLEQLGAPDG